MNAVAKKPNAKKGVGEKRKVFPVEETSERSERQKPWVSEEQTRVHPVERLRAVGFFAVSMLQPIYTSLGNIGV